MNNTTNNTVAELTDGMYMVIDNPKYKYDLFAFGMIDPANAKQVQTAIERHHETVWAMHCDTAITSDKAFQAQRAARVSSALVVKLGDLVLIGAKQYKVIEQPNRNIGFELVNKTTVYQGNALGKMVSMGGQSPMVPTNDSMSNQALAGEALNWLLSASPASTSLH